MTQQKPAQELSFEQAFERLETILEMMNSGKTSLEDSLKLYEEANQLIIQCGDKLAKAERKIETLMKNRTGELQIGTDGKPLTSDFLHGAS